ncbi:hypothetical protein HF521_016829 [Silurus meridionalis]|uniref:Uncharacterized protein n=1 Tax=Silurus meridionalis TaxID=175797 RepID=A0A8T0BSB7_SILME|nr:hypothetical protein HF521_016829 [Silurus meridionalis]
MVSIHRPLGYGPSTLPLRHSAYCEQARFYSGLVAKSGSELLFWLSNGAGNPSGVIYQLNKSPPPGLISEKLTKKHASLRHSAYCEQARFYSGLVAKSGSELLFWLSNGAGNPSGVIVSIR